MQHQMSVRNRVYPLSERWSSTYFITTSQLYEIFVPAEGWASGSVSNAHADGAVREKNKAGKSRKRSRQNPAENGRPHGHVGVP